MKSLETIKRNINSIKSWKKDNQLNYLREELDNDWNDMRSFSNDEKYDLLRHAMCLNKKAYVNFIAKEFGININNPDIKLWKNLENCDDKSWILQILRNQKNWEEFDDEYFFEQALKSTRGFYINKIEKKTLNNYFDVFKDSIDVKFLLKKEQKTGLSIWSYFLNKNAIWGDALNEILNIKPGWLDKDHYNIINGGHEEINEKNVDWNRIEKKLENYSDEAKGIVRKILDITIFEKIDEKYVIEKKDIPISFVSNLWLLKKEHFDLEIIYPEEKLKLLEVLMNNNNSPVLIKSANKEGIFLQYVLNSCLDDNNIDWQKIDFNKDAWRALELVDLDKIIKNNQLKSKLEVNLLDKPKEKKNKI